MKRSILLSITLSLNLFGSDYIPGQPDNVGDIMLHPAAAAEIGKITKLLEAPEVDKFLFRIKNKKNSEVSTDCNLAPYGDPQFLENMSELARNLYTKLKEEEITVCNQRAAAYDDAACAHAQFKRSSAYLVGLHYETMGQVVKRQYWFESEAKKLNTLAEKIEASKDGQSFSKP
ncbi:hypothetical protein JST99_04600 [Candidatus Dependentiae bacterium]|nr:hypothetical protein [Candidatus Dependentiae bacterium]MCC7414669.1 hypothetical protein [Campylobacterota bacterium]